MNEEDETTEMLPRNLVLPQEVYKYIDYSTLASLNTLWYSTKKEVMEDVTHHYGMECARNIIVMKDWTPFYEYPFVPLLRKYHKPLGGSSPELIKSSLCAAHLMDATLTYIHDNVKMPMLSQDVVKSWNATRYHAGVAKLSSYAAWMRVHSKETRQ